MQRIFCLSHGIRQWDGWSRSAACSAFVLFLGLPIFLSVDVRSSLERKHNPELQNSRATKFCTVARSSVKLGCSAIK